MNHNVYLFQPQYQIFVGDEINYWLPYSIGCLWSYVNQFDDISSQFNLGHLFFKRDKTEEVLKIIKELIKLKYRLPQKLVYQKKILQCPSIIQNL